MLITIINICESFVGKSKRCGIPFCCCRLKFAFVPGNVMRFLNTNQYNNYFLIKDIGFTLAAAYRQGDYLGRAAGEFIIITKEILD